MLHWQPLFLEVLHPFLVFSNLTLPAVIQNFNPNSKEGKITTKTFKLIPVFLIWWHHGCSLYSGMAYLCFFLSTLKYFVPHSSWLHTFWKVVWCNSHPYCSIDKILSHFFQDFLFEFLHLNIVCLGEDFLLFTLSGGYWVSWICTLVSYIWKIPSLLLQIFTLLFSIPLLEFPVSIC